MPAAPRLLPGGPARSRGGPRAFDRRRRRPRAGPFLAAVWLASLAVPCKGKLVPFQALGAPPATDDLSRRGSLAQKRSTHGSHSSSAERPGARDAVGRAGLSILIITYNHGEACSVADREFTRTGLEAEIAAANEPDIIVMMGQEVRQSEQRSHKRDDQPFETMIKNSGDYELLASSDITGITKGVCSMTEAGHNVKTVVQVAIKTQIKTQLLPNAVVAEHCYNQDREVCTEEPKSRRTIRHLYDTKGTKGCSIVHARIPPLHFDLRFVSVHLDTQAFEEDLRQVAEQLKELEDAGPGLTMVAGDFNNRIDPEKKGALCPNKKLTKESLEANLRSWEDLRLTTLSGAFKNSFGGESEKVLLVHPAAISGGTGETYVLPTYKFLDGAEADLSSASSVANQLDEFFKNGKICPNNLVKEEIPSFGVLDSVWYIYNEEKVVLQARAVLGSAGWRKLKGSDHAMISVLLRVDAPDG